MKWNHCSIYRHRKGLPHFGKREINRADNEAAASFITGIAIKRCTVYVY
jgi:hypothetical protein